MKSNAVVLGVALAFAPVIGIAQEKPSPDEVKRVVDYYYNGKGQGAILVETKLCQKVSVQGDTKNECVTEIGDGAVGKGEEAFLWMNFLVPAGDEARILIQDSRLDKVRDTGSIALEGATRYRTWKKIPTSTIGDWKVNIVQEMEYSDLDVGQAEFSVVEKP